MSEKRSDEELAATGDLAGEPELSDQALEAAAGGAVLTNSWNPQPGGDVTFR